MSASAVMTSLPVLILCLSLVPVSASVPAPDDDALG